MKNINDSWVDIDTIFSIQKVNQICPVCYCNMLMIYGCGWDYDRLVCGDRDCDYEVEFETSTYIDE